MVSKFKKRVDVYTIKEYKSYILPKLEGGGHVIEHGRLHWDSDQKLLIFSAGESQLSFKNPYEPQNEELDCFNP